MICPGGGEISEERMMKPSPYAFGTGISRNDDRRSSAARLEWTQHNWEDLRRLDCQISRYGDLKPMHWQDFERGRRTEIDFINGYVAQLGADNALPVSMNAPITQMVHSIENGAVPPDPRAAC